MESWFSRGGYWLLDQDGLEMQQVQSGQLDVFAKLVGRYQSPLFRYAQSRLGSRSIAEEAVQETFMAVYRSRDSYDPDRRFAAWLWTIHSNTCRRIARSQQESEAACLPNLELMSEISPSCDVEQKDDRQRLMQLLQELPDQQAEAVRLRFFGELSFDEIAAATGASAPTVKSRVRYGLAKLASLLGAGQENVHES